MIRKWFNFEVENEIWTQRETDIKDKQKENFPSKDTKTEKNERKQTHTTHTHTNIQTVTTKRDT